MSVTLDHVIRTVDGAATIRDVSLTLERGTLSVLLGPTLSGKTSIMRLLAGLDRPASGRVLVDGKDVTGFDVRKRSVAMVYQQFINYPFLASAQASRLAHAYGTRAAKLLGSAKSLADLGQSFGAGLTESEVKYLMTHEWARSAEDIVWRRSKLGLCLSAAEIAALEDWIAANHVPSGRPLLEVRGRK